jgi:hypothetical protein
MLVGTADPERLAGRAPKLESLETEPLALPDVDIVQVVSEIASDGMEAMLPPALHPTLPPIVSWLLYRCIASPWGAFTLAQTRIGCRSGARPRGFLVSGVIDNPEAARVLRSRWGYTLAEGEVGLHRNYHEIRVDVRLGGRPILDLGMRELDPLAPEDVQYVASMNAAFTPRGMRLVQVDPDYEVHRAERGVPLIEHFDAEAWGDATIRPVYPVSAVFAVADVTLPRLRYVCRPDVLAFEGTEGVP